MDASMGGGKTDPYVYAMYTCIYVCMYVCMYVCRIYPAIGYIDWKAWRHWRS
jgi:hypothetical protein